MKKTTLTNSDIDWIINNYATTKNQDICDKFNITIGKLKYIQHLNNLYKDRDFIIKTNTESCKNSTSKRLLSLKETYKKERRRVLFGFEQKTKLRVVKTPKTKSNLRIKLRKKGYEIARCGNVCYITENTQRSSICESNGIKLGLKFIVLN